MYTPLDTVNQTNIIAQIKSDAGYSLTVPYSNQETEGLIAVILSIVFQYLKKPDIGASLVYFIRELVMNASKANSKRVYFNEKGLNIGDPKDYQDGIRTFKKEVFSNFSAYAPKLKEQGFYVRVDFRISGEQLVIRVKNNSPLCREEQARIQERLRVAHRFSNMEEVFQYGFDDTEGGGFGLIIGVLMLRKLGLNEHVLSIDEDGKATDILLKIPINLLTKEQGMLLAKEMASEIERMPQFPESVIRLSKKLNDPNADFNSVAATIKTDPSLTTEIIRIANSPLYRLPRKVSEVNTAVKMIGLAGVKNLVFSYGANRVFSKLYKKEKIDIVLDHSYKVALYCSQIARQKRMESLIEDIYVAALLHDFGKIITYSLEPQLFEKLGAICRGKNIPSTSLEDLTKGYNHVIIGGLLAEKWNFPDKFTQCIKYHHLPLEADPAHKVIVFTCYLGNELYYLFRGERAFPDIAFPVLQFFGLETEDRFNAFVGKVKNALPTNM